MPCTGSPGRSGDVRTTAELRRLALQALGELVPADVLTWDRVELATGAVDHEAVPAEAEPPGAFAATVATAADHPLLAAHAARRRSALRLSEAVAPGRLSRSELYGDLLHRSGVEYGIAIGVRTERREAVVAGLGRTEREFSERDRDVLDLVTPRVSRTRCGPRRRAGASSARSPPIRRRARPSCCSTATARSSTRARTPSDGSPSTSGRAEHPGWLPGPVAEWLALPPRPPLVSVRDGRRLTVRLLPGDPHALLLEEEVATLPCRRARSPRPDTARHRGAARCLR